MSQPVSHVSGTQSGAQSGVQQYTVDSRLTNFIDASETLDRHVELLLIDCG
jgi:hypothetical protein